MYLHIHLDLIWQTTLFSKKTEKKKDASGSIAPPHKGKVRIPYSRAQ